MKKQDVQKGEIIIYKTSKNEVELKVRFKEESVWLRQDEIAKLFGKDRTVITKHINKISRTRRLIKKATCSILEQVAADDIDTKKLFRSFFN